MIASIRKTTFLRDVYEPAEVGCTCPAVTAGGALPPCWPPHTCRTRCTDRQP